MGVYDIEWSPYLGSFGICLTAWSPYSSSLVLHPFDQSPYLSCFGVCHIAHSSYLSGFGLHLVDQSPFSYSLGVYHVDWSSYLSTTHSSVLLCYTFPLDIHHLPTNFPHTVGTYDMVDPLKPSYTG